MSYGSNLSASRFRSYLAGGPVTGRSRPHEGARDPSEWRDERSMMLGHRLLFAGQSKFWGGGGIAFVDPTPIEPTTRARGYLITVEQFQDVLAQESGRPVGDAVDLASLSDGSPARIGEGAYDLVLHLGELSGVPMWTFTTPRPVTQLEENPPGQAYRGTLVAGLIESHGLDEVEAGRYVESFSVA